MSVEIRRDPNFAGDMKAWAAAHFPGPYVRVRELKEGMRRALDGRQFPYISQKAIGGIPFRMQVTSFRDKGDVDGICFEEDVICALVESIKPGDVVFDVGAATGTHTLPAALKTGLMGRVYAFEPDADCAKGLGDNLKLNPIWNVLVLEIALWREDTSLILYSDGRKGQAGQVGEIGRPKSNDFYHRRLVRARSIESLVQSGEVRAPDVVKIDVEGAGLAVLAGMASLRPREIFMEIHPLMGEDRDEIVRFLESRGYQIVWERPRGREFHVHFVLSSIAIGSKKE